MSYRKIEPVLIDLDSLTSECGMFIHGYGCSSRSKIKQEPGFCFYWDCPLAYSANIDDLKEFSESLYEQYKNDPGAQEECGNWMVQYREVVK